MLIATFGTALALASSTAVAAKPGGGGSTDPCAKSGLDFPAFAFWRPSGKAMEILVADAEGKCVRSVIKSSGTGGTIQFSYPVVGSDDVVRGRVAWVDGPAVVAVDFTVAPGTNLISVGPRRTLYSGTSGYISLSRDGKTLYTTDNSDSGLAVINSLQLDPLGTPTTVFTAADSVSFPMSISVDGTGSLLYADYATYSSNSTRSYQLVWIPLNESNDYHVIDERESASGEFSPAADPWSETSRVAYQIPSVTSGSCDTLVTSDVSGNPTAPLQTAYVMKSTWLNGKVLADGRAPSTRGVGCSYTGKITQTDPATGIQTVLTSGYDPDGK
jgi:hypothetical protein